MDQLVAALFLAVCNERLIEALITPLFEKLTWDKFYLMYLSFVTGGAISFLAKINLFTPVVAAIDPTVGMVLTAIVVGGGSSLIHDLFDKKQPTTPKEPSPAMQEFHE